MTTVLTNELLPFCVLSAGLDPDCLDGLDAAERELVRDELAQALLDAAAQGDVSVADPQTRQAVALNSVVYTGRVPGTKVKVLAFSFSNLAYESAFALAGLLLGAWAGHINMASVGSGGSVFKGLLTSAQALRSPQDDDAIAVLRAVGIEKMRLRWKREDEAPSSAALVSETGLDATRVANAVRLLETRKILRNVRWGGRSGDHADPANRWAVKV